MDQMTAFEQQLAAELGQMAGPGRRIDGMAMARSVSSQSPRWRFQSMFSATKFVIAGAIVALFGGILFSGVLTGPSDDRLPALGASASAVTQAEPTVGAPDRSDLTTDVETDSMTTTAGLLPGVELVTEEVEPGVFRVDNDGTQELARVVPREEPAYADAYDHRDVTIAENRVVAGLDGSVWIIRPQGYVRLGHQGIEAWSGNSLEQPGSFWRLGDVEVGPDGRLWSTGSGGWAAATEKGIGQLFGRLRSWDGEGWTVHRRMPRNRQVRDVAILPDGSIWAAWDATKNGNVGRLEGDEWVVLPTPDIGALGLLQGLSFVVTDDLVWILPSDDEPLLYHDGERWRVPERPGGRALEMAGDVGGTIWLRLDSACDASTWREADECSEHGTSDSLARYDGETWTLYDAADGVPLLHHSGGPLEAYPGFFEVDPDGRAWFNRLWPSQPVDVGAARPWAGCRGITSFDGSTFQDYLTDQCVWSVDIGPDGHVWLLASDNETDPAATADTVHVYVITPEAMPATGTP